MSEICIIGPRKSGKTTYLATLLRLPNSLSKKYPGLKVTPFDDNAEELAKQAADIIESGAVFQPNDLLKGYEPSYTFQIDFPKTKGLNQASFEVSARDYAGEVIKIAADKPRELEPYVKAWCEVPSWMILLTDWQPERDSSLYEPAFKNILERVSAERTKNQRFDSLLRVAVVITKCERGEIWPCRLDPEEDLFKVRLPNTYDLLRKNLSKRLKFFACSSFGVLDEHHDPRPNRCLDSDNPEAKAYLKSKENWHPYGLFSPIYWLCTGKTLYDESL